MTGYSGIKSSLPLDIMLLSINTKDTLHVDLQLTF